MASVQAPGPAAGVEVLEQRYGDPSGGLQRLPRRAGRERLWQRYQYPHREGRSDRQQDDVVGELKDPPGPLGRRELAMAEAPPLKVRALRSVERPLSQAGLESLKTRLGGAEGGGGARPDNAPDIELEPRVAGHGSDEADIGQSAGAPGCFETEPWIERVGNGVGVHGRREVEHPLAPLERGHEPLTNTTHT